MKLKKFEHLIRENVDDDIDWESQGKPYYGDEDEESLYSQDEEEYEEEEEEENDDWNFQDENNVDESDELEHLASLIRQMIRLSGIEDFYVYTKKFDVSIQFVLNKRERFSKMMKILGLLKKLSTDTLIQYDSELDLWETKKGEPLLTVDFYYDSNKKGSYGKDDFDSSPPF